LSGIKVHANLIPELLPLDTHLMNRTAASLPSIGATRRDVSLGGCLRVDAYSTWVDEGLVRERCQDDTRTKKWLPKGGRMVVRYVLIPTSLVLVWFPALA
jgi:hypothetical protein